MKKSWKNGKKRRLSTGERLIILIPAAAVVIAVVVIAILLKNRTTYRIEEPAYQYYGGGSFVVAQGAELYKDEKGDTHLRSDDMDSAASGLPIYYEEQRRIVLPVDMVYYAPREDICARIDSFTEVYCEQSGNIHLLAKEKDQNIQRGFLYDGYNLYIFLEPMILTVNGYSIELSALSYAEVTFGANVMAYDYEKGEFITEPVKGEVTAQAVNGDYSVYLMTDSMTRNEKKTLLFTRPDLLDPVMEQ